MNLPVAFSRKIHSTVCGDTVCRLVNLTIYWEVTGKFIGYSIPRNAELTKKDHVPFLESDYNRLSRILADSSSLLKFYTLDELGPYPKSVERIDGITGATIPDLSSWIVPNAAYTSCTLWHIAYGATRDSIQAYTRSHLLSKQMLNHLLQNSDSYNQNKAFQWIIGSKFDRIQFIDQALIVLHKGNFQAFGLALNFLKNGIEKDRLQLQLVHLLGHEDFRIKNMAMEYLRESQKFSRPVAQELMTFLLSDNYYLVNGILSLMEKRYDPDLKDLLKISSLLRSKNTNIANRVYYFLLSKNARYQIITKKLEEYSQLNSN